MFESIVTTKSTYATLTYEETKQQALSCEKCNLCKTRKNVVFCEGNPPCTIMCIGEAPGADEDATGIPFVGRAGQLLSKMLLAIDLKRPQDVYIANTLKCRPPGNRTPLPEEIKACEDFLLRQIAQVKPKIIILLGTPAMQTILNPDQTISKMRGKWFALRVDYQKEPVKVMTLFHPSYLLRNASNNEGTPKWLTWQDLKLIKEEYLKICKNS